MAQLTISVTEFVQRITQIVAADVIDLCVKVCTPPGLPIEASPEKIATATITRVTASVTSVTLKAANSSRGGLLLYNDTKKDAFVKYGLTASATSFTILMRPRAHHFIDGPIYTGIVDAIWKAGATGAMQVTELP